MIAGEESRVGKVTGDKGWRQESREGSREADRQAKKDAGGWVENRRPREN
jgi:hypothetical protein